MPKVHSRKANFDSTYDPTVTVSDKERKTVEEKRKSILSTPPEVEYGLFNPDITPEPPKFSGLHTGIATLDEELLGIRDKEMAMIGALPNVGKTTISLYLALNFVRQGKKVVYIAYEDSREDMSERLSKIAIVNGYEEEAKKLGFLCEDEALKLIEDNKQFIPTVNTLADKGIGDIFFLDMLNNIADPLDDKDFSKLWSEIRRNINLFDYSVFMTCRFRQPQGASQIQQNKERYSPTMSSYFGKLSYIYSATKCIAVAPYEGDTEHVALIVNKSKIQNRSKIPKRHLVKIGDKLDISQPENAEQELYTGLTVGGDNGFADTPFAD